MANDALELIKKAEAQADEIKENAKAKSAEMIRMTREEAEKAVAGAEIAAEDYKKKTLEQISEKADALIAKEADEAEFDASKVTNHANRMADKAVEYIIGSITAKN